MVDATLSGLERTDLIEAKYEEIIVPLLEGVTNFEPYRPEEILPDTHTLYFDWKGTRRRDTGASSIKTWEYIGEFYVMGYERREVQRRMKAAILSLDEALERHPTLGGAVKRKPEISNSLGPPIPGRAEDQFVLLKRFRISFEAGQAAV